MDLNTPPLRILTKTKRTLTGVLQFGMPYRFKFFRNRYRGNKGNTRARSKTGESVPGGVDKGAIYLFLDLIIQKISDIPRQVFKLQRQNGSIIYRQMRDVSEIEDID